MTVIQLPDDQAAALKARAAAQGLTLEAWFEKLSGIPESTSQLSPRRYRYSLAELMAQCDASAPLSAEDRAWIDAPTVGREA
jgi:antitoxin component of MazEF toxin-antitoxin module